MYYETIKDTLNTAAGDSLKAASESLHEITFDFSKIGSEGIIVSVLGYIIVFAALLFLFIFLANLTKVLQFRQRKRLKDAGEEIAEDEELAISGEINAAIAAAIYLHFAEVHDFENTVLTIKKVQKTYSPWSSKIYGLRQFPRK